MIAVAALAAPWFVYPVFLMKALCFALFACAFNLLLGYAGLMSFGHAMFFGMAGYFFGHMVKVWDWPIELGLRRRPCWARRCSASSPARWRSAARASTSR